MVKLVKRAPQNSQAKDKIVESRESSKRRRREEREVKKKKVKVQIIKQTIKVAKIKENKYAKQKPLCYASFSLVKCLNQCFLI